MYIFLWVGFLWPAVAVVAVAVVVAAAAVVVAAVGGAAGYFVLVDGLGWLKKHTNKNNSLGSKPEKCTNYVTKHSYTIARMETKDN